MKKPDWTTILLAILTLATAILNERQQRTQRQAQALTTEARSQWDNLGDYTIPEIMKLQARMDQLEKQCRP